MTSPLRSSEEPTLFEGSVGPAAMGRRLRARPPQGRRLGAPARLGDGLGVGGEEDGEPEPGRDLDLEPEAGGPGHRLPSGPVGDGDESHKDRGDLDDEHHRVLDQEAGVQLAERVGDGRPQELGIEHAPRPRAARPQASPRRG